MNSIAELQALVTSGERDWEQYGEVNALYQDGLVLFNYKASAQWNNRWNWFERVSRGLILDETTGEVVALPFEKFFNWGHHTTTSKLVECTKKHDGSLGILYRHNGYKIATRGSFDSEQAQWATEHIQRYDLSAVPNEYTLLFEIIYPENRIVIDYGNVQELILLGIRDRFTGEDFAFRFVYEWGYSHGFLTPQHITDTTIDEIIQDVENMSGQEGWVMRFADGERFKVKAPEYVRLHRAITMLSFKHTLEAGRDWYPDLPEPYLSQARAWQGQIDQTIRAIQARVEQQYEIAPKDSRKDFALWVKERCPDDASYMFARLDDRDYEDIIRKRAFATYQ